MINFNNRLSARFHAAVDDSESGHLPWKHRIGLWQAIFSERRTDGRCVRGLIGLSSTCSLLADGRHLFLAAQYRNLPFEICCFAMEMLREKKWDRQTRHRFDSLTICLDRADIEETTDGEEHYVFSASTSACLECLRDQSVSTEYWDVILSEGGDEQFVEPCEWESNFFAALESSGGFSEDVEVPDNRRRFWHSWIDNRCFAILGMPLEKGFALVEEQLAELKTN